MMRAGIERLMRRKQSLLAATIGMLLVSVLATSAPRAGAQLLDPGKKAPTAPLELRALWVDAYHDGFKTPEQADRLLADARRANVNTLLVQVRRRGDAYHARAIEPRTEDPALAAGFDPLQYLIDRAHNGTPRLEVHAWMAALPAWNSRGQPPRDSAHVFNLHGPHAPGHENWLMRRDDGESLAGGTYFLDPGHPDAARHTADVALSLVREYDVDGIHLDYIRYFEGTADRRWGYNETSVARFNARHGRAGPPAPDDPQWAQWRRDQVTALVRRIYLGVVGLKSRVKVSAAVIPWGNGPQREADWVKTSAYTTVFQDWRGWLEEGILDVAMPMNYYREAQAPQAAWFDSWVAWQRDHAYGRQVAPGIGLYLNGPGEGLAQIQRALAPAANGSRTAGVVLFSYALSNQTLANAEPADDVANIDFWAALATPSPLNGGAPPFAAPAAVPPMAWKAAPETGGILLKVAGLDGARVEALGTVGYGGETDGNGVYGLATASPGRYELTIRHPTLPEPRVAQVEVRAGAIAEIELR